MPLGWAAPAFDVLQVEDYDWVTQGRTLSSAAGRAAISARLGYPTGGQHYLAGFANAGLDATQTALAWSRIADAAALVQPDYAATFVWALPQVARDGFTYFRIGDADVQPFDDLSFPFDIGRRAQVAPGFSTRIVESVSGHEQRCTLWADARMRFDAGPGVRSEADIATLIAFFRARRGAARGFRFRDPFDHVSGTFGSVPDAGDQVLGIGDGERSTYQLLKLYGEGADAQMRLITRPVGGSVVVALDGVEQASGWSLGEKGMILFGTPPDEGVAVSAGFIFDVPVRFGEDALEIDRETFAAGIVPSVPLVEIRE